MGWCPLGSGESAFRLSQHAVDIWKERGGFREVRWSGEFCLGPCPHIYLASDPFPPPLAPQQLGRSTEPRAHLVEHILEIQLQIAEQAGRQGQAGQGVGQAGRQVGTERTAAEMLQ